MTETCRHGQLGGSCSFGCTKVLRRGIDTATGQAGQCLACGVTMPNGPDACLGYLPNVSHACCGHGGVKEAYVVIGGEPDEFCRPDMVTLRGEDARAYFAEVRQ